MMNIIDVQEAIVRINSVTDKYANIDSEVFMVDMGMIIDTYAHRHGHNPVQLATMIRDACEHVNETLGSEGIL